MTIQGTAGTLTNSVRTAYSNVYLEGAKEARVYDMFATPAGSYGVEQAAALNSTIQIPFLSDMQITETAISQVSDINPQTLRDATFTLTPVSRADALQVSEILKLEAYTNYGESLYKRIGRNMMETVDLLAQAAALKGENLIRATVRTSLDAGTTAHNISSASFTQARSTLEGLRCPAYVGNGRSQFLALGHPDVFFDMRVANDIVSVAYYQDKEILFNGEIGSYENFKILTPTWAKVFYGAGAANGSTQATTLSTAANALATTFNVGTAGSNIQAGRYLNIGTRETGNTHYPMNERVKVYASYSTGLTISAIGEGANGGLRFPHASGEAVNNNDSVYPVVWGSPASLVKLYANGLGAGDPLASGMDEYGCVVGPKLDGIVNQFWSIGWKWYGQYGRISENWLVRGEFSTRQDA